MKYIISESRLKEYMNSYLDGIKDSNIIQRNDPFLYIERPDFADGDDESFQYMEYDYSDGRLWINRYFLESFMSPFPFKDIPSAQNFIKEWFENEFNVEVKFVQS